MRFKHLYSHVFLNNLLIYELQLILDWNFIPFLHFKSIINNNQHQFNQKAMRNDYSQILAKSSVTPSITTKKSPGKYGNYVATGQISSPTRNQWTANDYSGIKKIPTQFQDLRQTYDYRSNSKFQDTISKANMYKDDPVGSYGKYDNFSKSQYSGSSSNGFDLANSAVYDRGYKKEEPISSYSKNVRSPVGQKKLIDIQQKYKQYSAAVQKFKEHVQTTNKMSEQLKKLKEDRKKRLQAKQKQAQSYIDTKANLDSKDSFKKKKSMYDYYSPKQEKTDYLNKYNNQPLTPKINLDKYKSSYNNQPMSATTKLSSKYDKYYQTKQTKDTKDTKSSPSIESIIASIKKEKEKEVPLYNGQVKDFILGKKLGQGKFGTVFQGFHKPTGSLYAIKKVPKDMIKSHLMVDQFLLQLKLQMFLDHENLLSLYNFFDDKTSIYLVLEYMEQGTLFSHLKKNRVLPQAEVAVKIKQIASAIKYLHQNQIAHRDIKPENIVMSNGVCKLCDFGWATICDERRKTYCGTFDYAPPEILAGAQYDYTVDLWCLGVLTYELLIGKAPFYHISRKQTMKKILNVEKTAIQYPENISYNAKSFIQNLIKKDPKERISSQLILEHPFLKNVPATKFTAKIQLGLRKSSY